MVDKLSLSERIRLKILSIDKLSEDFPCVIIIHNLMTSRVEYMSKKGLDILGVDLETLKNLGADYFHTYFNPEDLENYLPQFLDLLSRNEKGEVFTFFQQVRANENDKWEWYLSSSNIILRDAEEIPVLQFTMAQAINPISRLNHKVDRILAENIFLKNNLAKFSLLTNREKEILSLIAAGNSNISITDQLFISIETVETHRKSIKRKLEVNSTIELTQFARAFDLI